MRLPMRPHGSLRRLAAVAALLLAAACRSGGGDAASSQGGRDAGAATSATPTATAAFPRRVVDGSGRTLEIAAPPRRIVSQTLGTDELLFALVDHARIVGVSTLARDPAYSNVVSQAAALDAPAITSAEQVLTLRPDIVFVSSYSRAEIVSVLEQGGAPVFRFSSFDRIEDVRANIRRIGDVVGAEANATRLLAAMDARLAAVAERRARAPGPRPRVLSFSPSGFSAGAGTTFDDIVQAAGGTNVVAAEGIKGFPRLSAEQVLAWQPDFILVGINPGERESILRQFRENPAIAATRAMRADRIIFMENRALLAVSHHIADAVEALAAAFDARPLTAARATTRIP